MRPKSLVGCMRPDPRRAPKVRHALIYLFAMFILSMSPWPSPVTRPLTAEDFFSSQTSAPDVEINFCRLPDCFVEAARPGTTGAGSKPTLEVSVRTSSLWPCASTRSSGRRAGAISRMARLAGSESKTEIHRSVRTRPGVEATRPSTISVPSLRQSVSARRPANAIKPQVLAAAGALRLSKPRARSRSETESLSGWSCCQCQTS